MQSHWYIEQNDGSEQDCIISTANALEIPQSCTESSEHQVEHADSDTTGMIIYHQCETEYLKSQFNIVSSACGW